MGQSPMSKMLRYLFLEMFGLSLTALFVKKRKKLHKGVDKMLQNVIH